MTDTARPKARLPRGFSDRGPAEIRRVADMMEKIRGVYERWGFEPAETPLIEFADALGKFLPDQDRPNEGVFAFQDNDEQWLSLRYDLTAPLARMVAENFERIPKPYKSYRSGWVFRNEKPGPGRFRQFMQFDADIVGSASPLADAEICMMAADTMEALGFVRGEYVIRVNDRRVLEGLMDSIGINLTDTGTRSAVLRTIDKIDRLSVGAIFELLGEGRVDESGDRTPGAGLTDRQRNDVVNFVGHPSEPDSGSTRRSNQSTLELLRSTYCSTSSGERGYIALARLNELCEGNDYKEDRIKIDFSCVRGLEYYTGAVFEAELLAPITDEHGRPQKFGSVGGGGRYDGLVGRFRGENVPSTGFSVGISRLAAALAARDAARTEHGPVVVTVMDRAEVGRVQALTAQLRKALNPDGAPPIPVEMYIGTAGMKAQLKYADRRNAPCVIIEGSEERANQKVQIKDLAAGKAAAEGIDNREDWIAARPAQQEAPYDGTDVTAIVAVIRSILGR